MNSRLLVEKTLNFDSPESIPRQIWLLPWAEKYYPVEVEYLRKNFPDDIVSAPALYLNSTLKDGERYEKGVYTDEWGCAFENIQDGVIGIVKEPIIAEWEDLDKFSTPDSTTILDVDQINSFCRSTDKFVLSGSVVRPFERFQFLRTMENALMDLLIESTELTTLINMLHDHYLREVEAWAKTDVDGIALMDDWGTQSALITSPEVFKKHFLPMYKDYCDIARKHGKYVFMHSDGYITDIIGDLIDAGVQALNSQVYCMGAEDLGKKFRGKITFWGEIDRQQLLPFATTREISDEVRSFHDHLYSNGGVIAQSEFGPGAKPENVRAVFETWDEISKRINEK